MLDEVRAPVVRDGPEHDASRRGGDSAQIEGLAGKGALTGAAALQAKRCYARSFGVLESQESRKSIARVRRASTWQPFGESAEYLQGDPPPLPAIEVVMSRLPDCEKLRRQTSKAGYCTFALAAAAGVELAWGPWA